MFLSSSINEASQAISNLQESGSKSLSAALQRRPARARVGTAGPVSVDWEVTIHGPVPTKGNRECSMRERVGGGVVAISDAVQRCGATPVPCVLIGDDASGVAAKDDLGERFGSAQFAIGYQASRRRTVVRGGPTFTMNPPLLPNQLPKHFRSALAQLDVVIVAPMAAEDHEFVADALSMGKRSICQLSDEQLADETSMRRIINSPAILALTANQAQVLTGLKDPCNAIMWLTDAGCRGAMVTDDHGTIARFDDQWGAAAAHDVQAEYPVDASPLFLGVFAAAQAEGRSLDESLKLGEAASARFKQRLPLIPLDQLALWAGSQPKVPWSRPAATSFSHLPNAARIAVATAATLIGAIATWEWASV